MLDGRNSFDKGGWQPETWLQILVPPLQSKRSHFSNNSFGRFRDSSLFISKHQHVYLGISTCFKKDGTFMSSREPRMMYASIPEKAPIIGPLAVFTGMAFF
jgi:hypothetical protein